MRDLLERSLRLLSEKGFETATKSLAEVEAEPDEERSQSLAVAGLRRISKQEGKRFILLIENLDALFERRLDRRERAAFRRLLMHEPFFMIIGTAVRVFGAVRQYDEAFFNYFCPVTLDRLDDDQVEELLVKRAEFDGNDGFRQQYRQQRPKVRAISHLTGGNPRLALMLYELISQRDVGPVVHMLRQLVDQLTPLLKDVVEGLPIQQAKVLDALLALGGVGTPRRLRPPVGSRSMPSRHSSGA